MGMSTHLIQQFTNCAAVECEGLAGGLMPQQGLLKLYKAMQTQLAELTSLTLERAYGVSARGEAHDVIVEAGNPYNGYVFLFLTPQKAESSDTIQVFERDLRRHTGDRIRTGMMQDRFAIQAQPMTMFHALSETLAERGVWADEVLIRHSNALTHLMERAGLIGQHDYIPAYRLH